MILKKNVNLIIAICIVIMMSFFVASLLGSNILLIGMMLFGLLLFSLKCDADTIRYFIICTIIQNIVLIMFSSYLNGTETQIIILIKELIVYICGILYFIKYRLTKPELVDWIFIFFILYSIFNIVYLSPSLVRGFIGLRQLLIVFMCFYFGKSLKLHNKEEISRILNYIVYAAVLVSIIGYIILFLPDFIWDYVGYAKYWFNKTGTTNYSYINFYTWDLGIELKRIVSVFADPLACAHFIGTAFVILFIQTKKRILLKINTVIALILGMSKASIVLIVSVILVKNYSKIKKPVKRCLFILLLITMGGLGILYLNEYTSSLQQNTSIGNHFNAFLYGIGNITLLGKGYGTTGYNAIMMGAEVDSGFGESFFASCIGQIGIIGTLMLYFFIIINGINLFKRYRKYLSDYYLISLILIVAITLESLFSASAISMLGTSLYFILAGISTGLSERVN